MAGDWIKMRCALMHDPKVVAIGRYIQEQPGFAEWLFRGAVNEMPVCDGALRFIVTGALHVTWSVANEHAKSGAVEGGTLDWIDLVTGIRGFGKAMEMVGWASAADGRLVFPKFDDNNTSGAERMRKWREKKRQKRDGNSDVTCSALSDVTVTLEKRREEKSKRRNTNTVFVPPSVEEVAAYCTERFNGIDAQSWCDFWIARGWKFKGGGRMSDWKAALRNYETSDFNKSKKPKVVTAADMADYDPSGDGT